MNRIENSCGEIMELLPVGARIHHKEHSELTGKIAHYEYCSSGKVSPLPYCVHWDNPLLAYELLGFFNIYPTVDSIGEES